MAAIDDIDTIVIVMMENRSFDHVLGHLHHPQYGNRTEIDGLVDPATTADYDNVYDSQVYKPVAAKDKVLPHDLPHTRSTIATQIDVEHGQATMAGFVTAYVDSTHSVVDRPPPMDFQTPPALPVTDFLANEYLVCNSWFAPVPSGTQPNRSVAFTGTTLIDDNVSGLIPHDQLVLDWLTSHQVRWRVYHSGLSFFLLFDPTKEFFSTQFRSVRELARDFQDERPARAPQVVFIEPEYEDSPVHLGFTPNDNHPPLAMAPGEAFLHMVYSALASNPKRWAKTMLVVCYDEHGGFFDHRPPRPVHMDPPPAGAKYADPFMTTGVRVPALIASPMVQRGGVSDVLLDHTSLLQLLAEKFAGGARNYSDAVTQRIDQGIASLSATLTRDKPRQDLPLAPAAPIVGQMHFRGGIKRTVGENQLAFKEAARLHLQSNRRQALRTFPELAMLSADG